MPHEVIIDGIRYVPAPTDGEQRDKPKPDKREVPNKNARKIPVKID